MADRSFPSLRRSHRDARSWESGRSGLCHRPSGASWLPRSVQRTIQCRCPFRWRLHVWRWWLGGAAPCKCKRPLARSLTGWRAPLTHPPNRRVAPNPVGLGVKRHCAATSCEFRAQTMQPRRPRGTHARIPAHHFRHPHPPELK